MDTYDRNKIYRDNTWWDDLSPTVYIGAIFKDGVFKDEHTQMPVKLLENTRVKMIIHSSRLPDKGDQRFHNNIETIKFLEKDSVLFFYLNNSKNLGEYHREFKVILLENLVIQRKGNKTGRLLPVLCEVYDAANKLVIKAYSLNQAYTSTSVKIRPEAPTHTANVFKVFYHEGHNLDKIRPF